MYVSGRLRERGLREGVCGTVTTSLRYAARRGRRRIVRKYIGFVKMHLRNGMSVANECGGLLSFRLRAHQQLPLGDEPFPLCLLQLLLLHLGSLAGLGVPNFGSVGVILENKSVRFIQSHPRRHGVALAPGDRYEVTNFLVRAQEVVPEAERRAEAISVLTC